jgi:hypothetical protein
LLHHDDGVITAEAELEAHIVDYTLRVFFVKKIIVALIP